MLCGTHRIHRGEPWWQREELTIMREELKWKSEKLTLTDANYSKSSTLIRQFGHRKNRFKRETRVTGHEGWCCSV